MDDKLGGPEEMDIMAVGSVKMHLVKIGEIKNHLPFALGPPLPIKSKINFEKKG